MRFKNELLLLNIVTLLLIVIILIFPSSVFRIIIGLPYVLFCPGYALLAALFTRKEGISSIERIALSFGVSLAIVPLIALILNYMTWGIKLTSILYSIAFFIIITSIIAWFRRKKLPMQERFHIDFHLPLFTWGKSKLERVLSVILVMVILGTLGAIGYVIATPKIGEKFTEFYILGTENRATEYPRELKLGEEARLTIGIINNEYETVSYHVEITLNGVSYNELEPIVLAHEEKVEQEISVTPKTAGDNQQIEFLLYKDDEPEPYMEPLRLWIDIK